MAETESVPGRGPGLRRIFRQLYHEPPAAVGTTLVLLFILIAILGPLLAPYGGTELAGSPRLAPSADFWFGTDHLGRDVLSRVILGTRSILGLAGSGTLLAVIIGTSFGLISGYRGGLFDEILMRSFDSLLAIPALLLSLLLLGTIGPSRQSVLIVIIIVYTPIVARVVRSEVLAIKHRGFVEAAQLQGESLFRLLFREILPSALPALAVEASLRFSYAIFLVASLGFLGVGVQPPTPDWGLMINEGRDLVRQAPWSLYFPAGAISLLVIAVNLMADGLKRVLQNVDAGRQPKVPARTPVTAHSRKALLEIEDLTVSYYQAGRWLDVVRNLSLRIEPGQTYGLVGESGSGKSTLALTIMRYLAENGVVRQGRIHFEGEDHLAKTREQMEKVWGLRLNLVPQDPLASLNPSLRVGEQIAETLRHHRQLTPAQARQRTLELLASVRLPDSGRVAASYPHHLSGGMQQRIIIAMALSTDPALLILDEPTTSLDVTTEAVILDLFRELIREHNAAALFVSHNLGVVAGISDRVAVLYAGELVEDAATSDLYRQPLHPYTQGLLDSIPRLGLRKSDQALVSMPGAIPPLDELPPGCIFTPRCPLAIEVCHQQRPTLDQVDETRRVRCHRWPEILAGEVSASQPVELHLPANATATVQVEPVLVIEHLKKDFRQSAGLTSLLTRTPPPTVKAVDGVSLQIKRGQTLGLVGESGSGKTTLSRAVMALVEDVSGSMELLNMPLPDKLTDRGLDTLRHLQMVFQNPDEALNPYLTIGESLRRPLMTLLGQSRAEAETLVAQLLRQVRLPGSYARRLPAQLSGGEKQRVAIARAFAANPELVVYDEAVSALDVSVQAAILNLLNDLQIERGSSYLFISHDLAVVSYLADEIAVIYLGHLMEVGPTSAILRPPYHPYTEALLAAVPRPDPAAKQAAIRLEGEIPSPTNIPGGCRFHTRCPRFLGEICVTQEPPWREAKNGHRIYCHIPLETLEQMQAPLIHLLDREDGLAQEQS